MMLPRFKLPKISIPRIRFILPQIRMPRFSLPALPSLSIPKFHLPTIKWPQFSIPSIEIPKITFPTFDLPRVRIPTVSWPTVSWPTLSLPKLSWPKLPRPSFKRSISVPTPAVFRTPKSKPIQYEKTFATAAFCGFVICAFAIGFMTHIGVKAADSRAMNFIKNADILPFSSKNLGFELNDLIPAAGGDDGSDQHSDIDAKGHYQIEEDTLDVEAVLIPRETTVISSSQDSKIKSINFDNGELFKKGDILVEYGCKDVRAEVEIAKTQQALTAKQASTSHKLFKLDIISDLEKLEIESENKQAKARIDLYESRMDACFIRAEYDGRVVKRLANAGEFTRTDRVLMEIASLGHLKAEFLLPSRWLRWVDVGAPITIQINETNKTYNATIKHIYGEVDPVSQSVQVTAQLESYADPLLPGMSGTSTIDLNAIRDAGIYGFLEVKPSENEPSQDGL